MKSIKSKKHHILNACVTTNIVCRPNCPPGRRTKPQNRVHFKSLNDAYLNGFRDCLVCKPSEGRSGPWVSKLNKLKQAIGDQNTK
jgi:methylphosphotriester-DNA--protein-cysteine methyltransferase